MTAPWASPMVLAGAGVVLLLSAATAGMLLLRRRARGTAAYSDADSTDRQQGGGSSTRSVNPDEIAQRTRRRLTEAFRECLGLFARPPIFGRRPPIDLVLLRILRILETLHADLEALYQKAASTEPNTNVVVEIVRWLKVWNATRTTSRVQPRALAQRVKTSLRRSPTRRRPLAQ